MTALTGSQREAQRRYEEVTTAFLVTGFPNVFLFSPSEDLLKQEKLTPLEPGFLFSSLRVCMLRARP